VKQPLFFPAQPVPRARVAFYEMPVAFRREVFFRAPAFVPHGRGVNPASLPMFLRAAPVPPADARSRRHHFRHGHPEKEKDHPAPL